MKRMAPQPIRSVASLAAGQWAGRPCTNSSLEEGGRNLSRQTQPISAGAGDEPSPWLSPETSSARIGRACEGKRWFAIYERSTEDNNQRGNRRPRRGRRAAQKRNQLGRLLRTHWAVKCRGAGDFKDISQARIQEKRRGFEAESSKRR